MNLNEQIYNFFNEARPRTKNAGVEDIERRPVGQGRSKGDRPKPYSSKEKRIEKEKLKALEMPQEGRSLFKEGYVHEISFVPANPKVVNPRKSPEEKKVKGSQIDISTQKYTYYTIYRKITQAEFNKIKNSPYPSTIYPTIDEPEHFKDLYYINFPLPLYGTRVHSATDLEVSIDLVPLSDIYEKGVGIRDLPHKELDKYVTEVPKIRYPFSLEDLSFKYASNLTLDQASNVKKYVDSFKPNEKVEKIDRKKAKETLQSPEKMAAIAASGIFSYSIEGGRLDGDKLLNRILSSQIDLMKSSLQDTYDYYQPKRVDAQGNNRSEQTIELKETDPIIQSFLKDRKEKNLPPLELDKEYSIENKKGYTVTLTNDDKTKARKKRAEDIKNFLYLMDSFIETFPDSKEKNVIKKSLIEDPENIIQRRLIASNNGNLYKIIKTAYDGKKSTVVPAATNSEPEIKKDKVEPKTQKDKKEVPPKPETGKETVKDVKTEAEGFFKNSKHNETFRKLIEAFSATIEKDEKGVFKFDKIQRQDQYKKLSNYTQELIEQIIKYTDQVPVRDYIVKNIINDRIDVLIGKDEKENSDIKMLINTNYENMKNKPVQEITISEAEGPSKKYAIELKADSDTDKLYISKKVPKVFGRKNTYIRSLTPDQVKSVNRSVDVVSVEELPKDAKGFIKPSSSFRDKEKGNVVRFDPKNPKDIENLTGKLKPGEKLYSVNIKMGDAKSQDAMMPLSQIEKLIPDIKFGKDIKQPFEKDMFRAISKDTGEKIYDKVKGVLSFNSTDPIDGTKDDKKAPTQDKLPPPAQFGTKARGSDVSLGFNFYLVDMSQPEKYPNGRMYRNASGGFVGGNDRTVEKEKAEKIGADIKVYQKAEIKSKGVAFEDVNDTAKTIKKNYNFYLLDPEGKVIKDKNGILVGADTKKDAEMLKMDFEFDDEDLKDIKVIDKEQLKSMLLKKEKPGIPGNRFADYVKNYEKTLSESLSKEDITKLKSSRMSFTIQSRLKADEQYNVSDTVKEVKEEKGNIIIELSQAGTVTFDKEGTGKFFYKKDKEYYQTLNVPQATLDIIKKALAPSKDSKEPESQLEAYIRQRIRQAIKETEVSQYWGYQGKDVKKKRLEEYMKRYEWGFQDSENPYTHSNGSAIHAIVSKLVHELAAMGVDAIAIFNSYAPKGYQVSDLDQLDYASDSPLGSQLTQPYNPDSLTARGGRVAEEDGKVTSIAQQQLAKLDKLSIKQKAQAYLRGEFRVSQTATKKIEDDITAEYRKNPLGVDKDIKDAFMKMSDEDLKKNG